MFSLFVPFCRGLTVEDRESLLKKYALTKPASFQPPDLNFDMKAGLEENITARDQMMMATQNALSLALTSLGLALSSVLKSDGRLDRLSLIERLGDVGRLLSDQLHQQTRARRSLILPKVQDHTSQDILKATTPDAFLFGKDFSERLKASKSVASLSKALFTPPPKPSSYRPRQGAGNDRGLARNYYSRPNQAHRISYRDDRQFFALTDNRTRKDRQGPSRWEQAPPAKQLRQ